MGFLIIPFIIIMLAVIVIEKGFLNSFNDNTLKICEEKKKKN